MDSFDMKSPQTVDPGVSAARYGATETNSCGNQTRNPYPNPENGICLVFSQENCHEFNALMAI